MVRLLQAARTAGVATLILMVLLYLVSLAAADPIREKSEGPKPEERMSRLVRPPQMRLGVGVERPSEERAERLKLDANTGLVISEVWEESPAARAGFKQDDVLIRFNGKAVTGDPAEFARDVETATANAPVAAEVIRNGKVVTIEGLSLPESRSAHRPAAVPKSRVAIFNLKSVVTRYTMFKLFQQENKEAYEEYERRLQPMTARMELLRKALEDALFDADRKAEIGKETKDLQQQIKDITEEARAKLGKAESDQLLQIYKQVTATVRAYAEANDLELVLHYSDGINEEELNSPPNIHQKMGQRAMIPAYFKREVDISDLILEMLDARFATRRQR